MAGSGHGEKLTRCKARAVAALLTEPTIGAAAKAAGVSERTLRRWLADVPEFGAAYRAARRGVFDSAMAQLQIAATEAVGVLVRAMRNARTKPATRIRAAHLVLNHARRGIDVDDLLERVEALESALLERNR
ncbi:MAG TPA: hypothetical protein VM487_21995 [Phycisphaerae bacterium]|nr:hypothetical protein [Phycisphaerae bacterium]